MPLEVNFGKWIRHFYGTIETMSVNETEKETKTLNVIFSKVNKKNNFPNPLRHLIST